MFQVARHAAKSFMNTNRRTIVCHLYMREFPPVK